MFRRIAMTALSAGVLAGVFMWALQMVTTTPMIMAAEVFENGGTMMLEQHAHDGGGHSSEEHSVEEHGDQDHHDHGAYDGFERHGFTLLTTILMGTGFGFILSGVFALRNRNVGLHEGVLWGLGGFAALYVSPALGLPPELPGMMASDLDARQIWWLFAAAGSAVGLSLIVFSGSPMWKLAGVIVMVIPHVVGAPHPALDDMGLGVPAELAARFAVTSLITVGLFWIVLGGLVGYFYDRFADV